MAGLTVFSAARSPELDVFVLRGMPFRMAFGVLGGGVCIVQPCVEASLELIGRLGVSTVPNGTRLVMIFGGEWLLWDDSHTGPPCVGATHAH